MSKGTAWVIRTALSFEDRPLYMTAVGKLTPYIEEAHQSGTKEEARRFATSVKHLTFTRRFYEDRELYTLISLQYELSE